MMFEQTQEDLKVFHTQMSAFWKHLPDDAWTKKTGTREKDWTMHALLAHLLSIAQMLNKAGNTALKNENLVIRGLDERDQFGAWNNTEIERLTKVPPNGLIVQFLQELRIGHETLSKVHADNANNTSKAVMFSRPAPAIEYIQSHLSHAGVIHGAQSVFALERAPLWHDFSPEFTQRVIKHYLNQWSLSYWIEEGGEQSQVINFHIGSDGGGDWHILTSPTGASVSEGVIDDSEFHLFFTSPDIFFSIFTNTINMRQAMADGQLRVAGDVRDTLSVLKLFGPSR